MRNPSRLAVVISIAGLAGIAAAALVAGDAPAYRPTEKAYYADQALVTFVRPGLNFTITKASVAADGTVTAWVKITDAKGMGLDRLGVESPGTISASFLLGYIPSYKTPYVSYITRTRTGAAGTVTQATGESTGTWTSLGSGAYTYQFANKLPSGYDSSATHTIGIYGSRSLTEWSMGTYYDDATYNFVPNGTAVTVTRDIIRTASCNNCHDQLAMHGGSRRSIEICNMCHTPQTPSSAEGNTTDMRVMIHKIHYGENLPSVKAGTAYKVGGHDYSEVAFPAQLMACKACHEDQAKTGATQADFYKMNPSRAACGSCHDDVNFATGANHASLPQVSDSMCSTCHQPTGELDFDISITGAHTVPIESTLLSGLVFSITEAADVSAGKHPTVTFVVKDRKGTPVNIAKMSSLRLYMGGPASDITGYVREDVRAAQGPGDGRYFWTFAGTIPASATGTWQFGIEGYNTVTVLAGTTQARSIRDYGKNALFYAKVGGGTATPRRTVVTTANCNKCHYQIEFHGGNRNDAQMCTFCHTSSLVADGESWNYVNMVHRIHSSEVGYPGNLATCTQCHAANTVNLPLSDALNNVTNPAGLITPTTPTTNACLSCHNTKAAWSHAAANTTTLGESCDVCHGTSGEYSVAKVHAQ